MKPWEAEARYKSVFSQAAVGMAIVSLEGHWLQVNQRLCEITGYSERELLATTFQAITHPDDLTADMGFVQRLLTGEIHDYSLEKRYLRKDGRPTWIRLTVSLVRDDVGRPQYFASIIQPLDAQKELERRAGENQEKLEALFRQAAVGLLLMDGDTRILRINRRLCDLLGYTEDELVGSRYMPMNHPDDIGTDAALLRQLLAEEIAEYIIEKRIRRRNGSYLRTLISATLVRQDASAPYIVSVIQDIEARKDLETELRAATQELEQRVEARTGELRLAWQHTEDALRAAESANRLKSEFLATMSHEIRTPLNGVLGFSGLLVDSPLNEEQHRYAELVHQSGEHLLLLLNDFLDYSKIEAGHMALEPTDFDLHVEIGHVLSLVDDSARNKGLSLRHVVDAPHHLHGDAVRLRQVLLNLLSNAIKFTEQGQVQLRCAETSRRDTTVWLYIQVIDTGIGIASAATETLFHPFTQADASITRRYGGTGLGLAICKRLVEVMGGQIGCSSTPGEGSTFWVSLPFEWRGEDSRIEVHPALAEPLPTGGCQGRVLVVEDNPTSQMLALAVLQRLGCRVDVAGNGQEAIEAVKRLPYDLVFMDCDMPVMNGFDATRAIRAMEGDGPHLPIVALTASTLAGDCERCLAAGMDDFLAKPVRPQALAKKVSEWVTTARGIGG